MVRFPKSYWAASVAGVAFGGTLLVAGRMLGGAGHPFFAAPLAGSAQTEGVAPPLAMRGAIWPCLRPVPWLPTSTLSTAASDPPDDKRLLQLVTLGLPERRP